MATAFGAPSQFQPGDDTSQPVASAPEPSPEPQDLLDPNDPRLVSEPIEMNLEGDAYATPPPPPDAKYRAKLKLAQKKDPSTGQPTDYVPAAWGKDKTPCFVTGIEASIIDPTGRYDGIKVFDFNVSTMVGRDHSSKVSTILATLRKPDGTPWVTTGERLNQKEWMERLIKALAGEPEASIETVWEWSCRACGEEAKAKGTPYPRSILGMQRFPPDAKVRGAHDPEMRCSVNAGHGYSRARVNIARVLPLK